MSVCVNHTDRTATTRCSSCHKPICNDCIIKSNGVVFCSAKCSEGAARFSKNFKADRGPGFFGKLTNTIIGIVGLCVVLGLVAAACAYVLKIQSFVNLFKKFGL